MAVRKHETVAVGPERVVWVKSQEVLPEAVGDWRKRHGCPRMAGVGLLHGIHRQRPDGVDTELIPLVVRHRCFLVFIHISSLLALESLKFLALPPHFAVLLFNLVLLFGLLGISLLHLITH